MTKGVQTLACSSLHPRLKPGEEDFLYNLETVLGSRYYMDARKPVDRFLRYERVLDRHARWAPLEFEQRTVVEIGSGPMLGWGPLAVYLGAQKYVCIEPRFRSEILDSDEVWVRYFLPLHQQLEAIFDRHVPYEDFAHRIRSRIQVHASNLEACRLPEQSADLVISIGSLQHIADLEDAVQQIDRASRPGARQFHAVNFTDHMSPPDDPFRDIYRLTPVEYFERDSLLNLKRPSDIVSLFQKAGISLTLVPYCVDRNIESRQIVDYWKRYDMSDLAIQIAFFVK